MLRCLDDRGAVLAERRTATVYKTLQPVWNELFPFDVDTRVAAVRVSVMDWDGALRRTVYMHSIYATAACNSCNPRHLPAIIH
eukprot:COSAG03_NODE_1003_length_5054_cov_26.853280_8_plen_83_part_00